MLHYDPRLVIASVIIISCMFTHACASISIEPSDFLESVYPLGSNFTGTQPWPDRSGMQCGENAAMLNMASPNPFWLFKNDTFLKETLPGWRPTGDGKGHFSMEKWVFISSSTWRYCNRQRNGKDVYAKPPIRSCEA